MKYYRQSLLFNPDHYIAYFNLACCYSLMNEPAKAIEELSRISSSSTATQCIRDGHNSLRHDPDFKGILESEYEDEFSLIEKALFPNINVDEVDDSSNYYTF